MGLKPRRLSSTTSGPAALREFIEYLGTTSYRRAVESCDIDNYGGEDGKTDLDNAAGELDDLAVDYWDHIDRWTLATLFYELPDAVRDNPAIRAVMRSAFDIYLDQLMKRPTYGAGDLRNIAVIVDGAEVSPTLSPRRADLERALREELFG